jgi:hypothetical protein
VALLNRDQILDYDDLKTVDVEVPEWGGSVRLRMLTAKERDAFEASTVETRGNKMKQNLANIRARLVALCIVDEDGKRVFDSGDVSRLGEKSAAALQRLFMKCNELNGLSDEDVEELAEGFGSGQNGSSPSD